MPLDEIDEKAIREGEALSKARSFRLKRSCQITDNKKKDNGNVVSENCFSKNAKR